VDRYGGQAGTFQYGVDKSVYHPRPVRRRRDTVIAYARVVTPRRAVDLAFLGLAELKRRRPDARIVLFGNSSPPQAPFEYEDAGVAGHEQLAWLFSEATAGLCLSLTNYSLVPREMLACGLPCVELDRPGTRSVFAEGGPVALAGFDAGSIADELERLLDDEAEWERRSDAGLEAWCQQQGIRLSRGTFGRWLTRVREERFERQANALEAMRRLAGLTIAPSEYAQWESGSRVPREDNPKRERLYEFFGSRPEDEPEQVGPDQGALIAVLTRVAEAMEAQTRILAEQKGALDGYADGVQGLLVRLVSEHVNTADEPSRLRAARR